MPLPTPTPDPGAAGHSAFVSTETQTRELPGDLVLELGDRIRNVRVAYRTWGTLNAAGDNGVLVCQAGFFSIQVNEQFRIIFKFEAGNASAVQIVDYH